MVALFNLEEVCFTVMIPVDLGHVLVCLCCIADHGIDGGLLVVGEDGGDGLGDAHTIVHVHIHLPRLQLQARQIVPM